MSTRSWVVPAVAAVVWGWALLQTSEPPRPVSPGHVRGDVQVVEDPERFGAAVRLVVRWDGVDVEGWARGAEARSVVDRQVGEWVDLDGPVRPMQAEWRLRQGVVGRLEVRAVRGWHPGGLVSRAANGLRRTLAEGAQAMDESDAGLYLGLVLGDRRGQDTLTEDAFAGSGLTHVLAVSGSNVAFVLVLAGPVLRRMRFGGRLVATLGVVAFFAVVTRLEPSVLRAATMAGLAAFAVTFGWQAQSRSVLSVAVAVLLLVDPSLARSLGFQLSVAASLGIISLARPLAARIPGPRWLADPLSVTAAAQLAVSPLLLPLSGGLPVASLPANLLAVPATGPVMVWGAPAGVIAGLAGGDSRIAAVLHAPTSWLVSWVDGVARAGSSAPLGHLGLVHLVALTVAIGGLVVAGGTMRRNVAGAMAVAVLCHPPLALAVGREVGGDLGPGARLVRDNGVVVVFVETDARGDLVLEGLRRAAIDRIDVLVAVDGDRRVAEVVSLIDARVPPRLVLAPGGHRVRGASVPPKGTVVVVGDIELRIVDDQPRLDVSIETVTRARGPPHRSPLAEASSRTATARQRSCSWQQRPGTRRRSCRSRRSTTTLREVRLPRSPARTASRRCAPRPGAGVRRTMPR